MKNSKKILFLANHFHTLYSFRKEMIQEIINAGHEVVLSIPPSEENEFFVKMGCKIYETNIDRRGINPLKDVILFLQYVKMFHKLKPDIVFSFTIKPNIYGSLANRFLHCRQVCNITGTGSIFLQENILSSICRILYRLSIKHSYKIFFQNTGDQDYFINNGLVGKGNYSIIPGSGCNLRQHSFSELPEDSTLKFIYIGRVMKLKGIDEYLICAKYIRAKYPNTEFYIAGWNEEPDYMEKVKVAEKNEDVIYLGFIKDVDSCIKKCHCTILASHGGEGVPNVLLESAANGRICIASRINGNKDVVEDKITGYLFEPGNAKDLIEKVEAFISLTTEARADMGVQGRKKIEVEFDRNIVINRYLDEVGKL